MAEEGEDPYPVPPGASYIERKFPAWNEERVVEELASLTLDGEAASHEDGKFWDEADGEACPEDLAMFVETWKRPEAFIPGETPPMLLVKDPPPPPEDGEEPVVDENADPDDPSPPRQMRELISENVLFSANPATEWMWNALRLVNQRADSIDADHFLWENIWPKDNDGTDPENPPKPTASANGKYAVRMWVVDQWRCVWVDDRMPCDVFGRAALPGSRPIQLWPLLLCKATLKLMKHYGVLDRIGSHTVPMVPWLTGWPRENLGLDNAHGALHDRLLHALTDSKAPARVPHKAKNALPTVFLRDRWMPEHPPPRIIALCGPAGIGKQALVDKLVEEYPTRFGYGLAATSRPPHAHEVDGEHFHFIPRLAGRPRPADDALPAWHPKVFWEDLEDPETKARGGLLEHGINTETTLPLVPLAGDKTSRVHRVLANGSDDCAVKRYRYGSTIDAVSKVAAGGKLLFLTIDADGCEQLKANPAVDAYIVHVDTSTPDVLKARMAERLKVDESIVQQMCESNMKQFEAAAPGLSAKADAGAEEGAEEGAEPKEKPKEKPPMTKRLVFPPDCAESFYKLVLVDDPDDLYYELKVCCATLSPIVRNRLYGLPPHILDYSDVIPANKTEKVIVKPVILVGPNFREKAELRRLIFDEFPEVFHRPQIVTTAPLRPEYPAEDDPVEFPDDGMIHVDDTKWNTMEGGGEFLTTWKDQFAHENVTYRYAVTKASLEEAKEKELLCVCDVPRVGNSDEITEKYGDETMAIFVGPATTAEYERRLREYLKETDRDLEQRLLAAEAEKKRGLDSGLWQSSICLDDPSVAYEQLKDIVIQERPDILPPRDPNEGKPIIPIVICGPTGVGRKTIYRMLNEEFPDRFGYVCSKTTRAAKEGEEAGVHYEYIDRATFESELANGKFVEHAEIDGELFGTSFEAVQAVHDANKVPIIVADVQGVKSLREVYPRGAFCLVTPSSVDGLEARIRKIKETPPPPAEGEEPAEGEGEPVDEDAVTLPEEPPELTDEQKEEIAERLDKISRAMTGCDENGLFTDVIVSLDDAPELAYGDLKSAIARIHPKLVVPPPKPLVISGPLGSRKEDVFEALLQEFPESFGFPLATTTRTPEPGEIDGVHYRFVDKETFEAEAEDGTFLECTEVIVGYGEWVDEDVGNPPITVMYGTPFSEVKKLSVSGKMPVLETDAAGAAAMRAAGLDALFVFFAHPAHDTREHERNLADAGESPEAFRDRTLEAQAELKAANEMIECSKDGTSDTVTERVYDCVFEYEPHRARYARFKEAISDAAPTAVPPRSVWGFGRARWDPSVRVYGNKPTRVAVVGAAASGKSTVAQRLAKALDVPYVYPGALLRDAAYDNPTELGIEAKRYLDSTKTVPDDFMMTLVADRLSRDDCVVRGWILDGFPHNHYQATALLDAGFEPDKLVVVEVDHETVFSRTRGRLIDPLTGKVYHKEFAPVDEHEEGKEVAARLTIRHDDANEDNVKNRLAKYDFSDAPVRSLFPTTAHFFDGAESIDEIYQKVEEFVTLEDREHDTRHITDARDLPLLEYEVLDACVYRRRCCVLVREPAFVNPDGRKPAVWVDIEDFAKTAEDFTNSFRPSADQFAHTHRDARLDKFDLGPGAKMIHVDSPEPTVLAFTLTVAPPEPPPAVPMPAPLVLCGPGVHTLATTLAARYPEIYEVASVEPKPEEPKPEGDGEAKAAAAEETPEGEESAEPEAADTQADAEEEQAADADAPPTEPYVPEKYPGAKSVKAIQSKGICAVICLDPAGVVAFKAANAPPPPELDAEGNPIEEEPEVDADGNPIEKPEVPVPTLVCVGLPPMEPKQPRPPPKEVSEEAGEGEEEGEKEEEPLEDPKPKALTFDHVIYPNARSLDTPETTFEMLKGVFAVKVRLPAPPKDKVDTSTCEAVLHDYDWYKTGAPQRTVLTLATNTSQSATVHLPRGRHVLQLSVDPGFYFTADVRSQTAFDMDQPAKMLEEKQLAAPSLAEGTYPEMAAGDWHVWFRRVFKVDKPTTVSAALEVPDDAMSPFARFAVVDNDGAGEVTHFVAGAAPPKTFEPNTHGYTVMAYSKSLTPVPSGPWRLSALCDSPLASFDDQPVGEPTRFDGEYRPNYSHLVARVRLAIKNRSLLSIHFESDLPAGFTVTLTDPEDGWEEMQAEYLRGGHKGHLRGTELHRWDAYTMLTVPAMCFEPTEASKYLVLEVKLDNPRCAFDVQPNGDIPSDMRWKLTAYASDPAAVEWTVDSARENYFDQTLSSWNADASRKSKATEAYAKRVAELRAREYSGGENAPPTPAYRELSGDIATHAGAKALPLPEGTEAPADDAEEADPGPPVIELDPLAHRHVRRGTGERKVISMSVYEEREAHLRSQIEASKAKLAAFVEARERGKESRPERVTAKKAEFRSWRQGASQRLNETARSKRAAYLQSLKPQPADGDGDAPAE